MKSLATILFIILLGSSFAGQPKADQKEPEKVPWAYGPGLTGRPRTHFPGLWYKDPIVNLNDGMDCGEWMVRGERISKAFNAGGFNRR